MMAFDDLKSALGVFVEMLLEWLQYVRRPFLTCDRLLGDHETDQTRVKRAMKIWVSSFVISILFLTPIYKNAGIGLTDLGFHLSVFLFLTLAFLLASGVIHIGLRRYGVKSQFGDTLVIYSVFFGTFSPLLNLLGYPSTNLLLSSLKVSKGHNLGLSETVVAAVKAISAPSPIMGGLIQAENILVFLVWLGLTGMFAEAAAKYYQTDRQRVLSSMSFSVTVLGAVPALLCALLYYYVIFSFV